MSRPRAALDLRQKEFFTLFYISRMDAPGVEILLDIDRDYRARARSGELHRIAPRRQNPEGKAWLPVLHKRVEPWHFTALFSNTPRAHDLHRVYDWVVIFYSDHGADGQATVVTERRGALAGRRVVRGREPECARYYRGERISTRAPSLSASDG
jgi:DNA polymerase (family X)